MAYSLYLMGISCRWHDLHVFLEWQSGSEILQHHFTIKFYVAKTYGEIVRLDNPFSFELNLHKQVNKLFYIFFFHKNINFLGWHGNCHRFFLVLWLGTNIIIKLMVLKWQLASQIFLYSEKSNTDFSITRRIVHIMWALCV